MTTKYAVSCTNCQHLRVTWDPKAPRGCSAHGFKTDGVPSVLVERESGMPCQFFTSKKPATKKD